MTSAFSRSGAQVSTTSQEPRASPLPAELPLDFAQIFNDYAGYILGLLRRLGVRAADAQDVAQEVFVVVYRRLPEFEGRSSLKTWICGIAVHLAANQRRRAYVRREDLSVDAADFGVTSRDAWSAQRDRGALLRALDALDPKLREVFVLHEVEELGMADVVAIVGCPLFTGYTRLRTARKALRVRLREQGYGEVEHD
jgi:RNA polymerase sigma-70 factor (ECF subfamily)